MVNLSPSIISTPFGTDIYYQGSDLSNGSKPALLYFALSAFTTLHEDPFNQPVAPLIENDIRVFSWDLPYHGIHLDPNEAIRHWASALAENPFFISDFIHICQQNLQYLIEQGWIDPARLAVAGISRGGLIATHLAAQDARIKTVLGFAPFTTASLVEEFKPLPLQQIEQIDLIQIADRLTHAHLRFYIGNRDVRVGTDACYTFIRELTESAFAKGIRSPSVELNIYPSIGFKGHGTPPYIFQAGTNWIKAQLLK
ncbi:alpha/beta hydrolase family protein [Candidatus Protochlamydia phocaeensis]|uniref:alpha/beta hydrolase family protein n=1 Tax=Candidatus Protochlamydia phocaeensis TaxID=1414722 RepID=UPI000838DB4E|nr:prolyl oligopeptidase family serine peptidase [Candidatus Protochlamydia phocaeensis]